MNKTEQKLLEAIVEAMAEGQMGAKAETHRLVISWKTMKNLGAFDVQDPYQGLNLALTQGPDPSILLQSKMMTIAPPGSGVDANIIPLTIPDPPLDSDYSLPPLM
jgi:hypothetical protein